MADGSLRPIEDVDVGDRVWATDPETGEFSPRLVIDAIVGEGEKLMVDVTVDGETITATDRHPFWVDDEGAWVDAIDLETGDLLRMVDGSLVAVDAVGQRVLTQRVHNLTVEGIHTFHVGADDATVLVHNCIRNEHLAGGTHPKTGVPFDANGFPDFSDWRHPGVPDVQITPTGNRGLDEAAANAAAGLDGTPSGYTWHHHQDYGRMQLVESGVHRATGHTGGFSLHSP